MTTLRQLIDWTEQQFVRSDLCYGHGVDNALDEAAFLVLGALDIPFDAGPEQLDRGADAGEQECIRELVDTRIRSRKPVAYLLNKTWFAGMPFYVDERVLIPRSPIAELVQAGFSPWIETSRVNRILDLGTAVVVLPLPVPRHSPRPQSMQRISVPMRWMLVCQLRAARPAARVNLIRSDLFSALGDRKYDIIVGNPPYVPAGEMSALPEEYRHEPAHALAAGADGLDVVDRILLEAVHT